MFFDSVAHAIGAAPQGGEAGGNPIMGLMPLILMFVIFYFLLIRPQQKKAKQHREMLANIKKGDKVLTAGGIYGRVLEVDGDVLTVDIGHEMRSTGVSCPASPTARPRTRARNNRVRNLPFGHVSGAAAGTLVPGRGLALVRDSA